MNARTPLHLTSPEMMGALEHRGTVSTPMLDDSTKKDIERRVDSLVQAFESDAVVQEVPESLLNEIQLMGSHEITRSSDTSSRLLAVPMKHAVESTKSGSPVAKNLIELRQIVNDLNPNKKRTILGLFPLSDTLEKYLLRYQSSQKHLDSVLEALKKSSQDLALDNQALLVESENLKESAFALAKYLHMADYLDAKLTALIDEIAQTDPDRADQLRASALFYARQKNQDLKTHAVVIAQNYQALRLTIDNNTELQKSVERARTTTVSALRGAVMMRNALGSQGDVIKQVDAVSQMTSDLLVSTSEDMRANSANIQRQAGSATLDLEKVKRAYDNIVAAMDDVDRYRAEATESMRVTIERLNQGVMSVPVSQQRQQRQIDQRWLTVEDDA